ncbi:hypothetical protein CTheo_9205 [Ceratobasidium theobromae]|uniref:SH3 domain-containing protein n=1 Tax=Ceratobasidium theobromae TaxID=1582974 RepID=A0A5N5Q5R7_9AGAM|nr:hypothetical protein CTheo_9205 [Ceratobasidium theobromae]
MPSTSAQPSAANQPQKQTPAQPQTATAASIYPRPNIPVSLAPAPRPPRTLTVLYDFAAESGTSNELSLKQGQKLYLLPESDTEKEWIWCRTEVGTAGYAPKCYIKVDNA